MFAFLDSPVEIGIIVLVVLLLFGGSQLPKLAKNLGQAQKEFKDGISAGQKDEAAKEAKQPQAKWTELMDNYIKESETFAEESGKSTATQVDAKAAYKKVTATCAACHKDFRPDE